MGNVYIGSLHIAPGSICREANTNFTKIVIYHGLTNKKKKVSISGYRRVEKCIIIIGECRPGMLRYCVLLKDSVVLCSIRKRREELPAK